MHEELTRYAVIHTKMKREFLLLQGTGCVWKRCAFCDYHLDTSDQPFEINQPVISRLCGIYGVADVINSGSLFELDPQTLHFLRERLHKTHIHTLWCEAHWLYRNRLDELRQFFDGICVRFRIGAETFDGNLRQQWNKGIPASVTAEEIASCFDGACLLVCVQGQTKAQILHDIDLARKHFSYFSVNVFEENSTPLRRDPALIKWFTEEIAPQLKTDERIEVLIQNTDLGVG
ncbi:MAG: radical SAM protein [Ruminococcus sp.]|nr:radical SAM protein [Ruminococcus sp.]